MGFSVRGFAVISLDDILGSSTVIPPMLNRVLLLLSSGYKKERKQERKEGKERRGEVGGLVQVCCRKLEWSAARGQQLEVSSFISSLDVGWI